MGNEDERVTALAEVTLVGGGVGRLIGILGD